MVIKFTCYTPQDVGEKLKKLQKDKCLNVSKFITTAIVEKSTNMRRQKMFNENRYFNNIMKKHREKENAKSREELWFELTRPFKDVTYDMKLIAKVNKDIEHCIKCCKTNVITETYKQYMLNLLRNYHLEIEEAFTQEDVQHTYPYYLQMTLEGLRRLVFRYHVWGYLHKGIRYLPIWYLLDCIENHLLKNL